MPKSTKNRLLSPLILYLISEKLSIGVRIFSESCAKERTPTRNEISASALDFVILRFRQGLFQVFDVAFLREIVAGLLGDDARKRNQGNNIRQGH